STVTARTIADLGARADTQSIRDELDLAQGLVSSHERQRAQVVLVAHLSEPRLRPFGPPWALGDRFRHDRKAGDGRALVDGRSRDDARDQFRAWRPQMAAGDRRRRGVSEGLRLGGRAGDDYIVGAFHHLDVVVAVDFTVKS